MRRHRLKRSEGWVRGSWLLAGVALFVACSGEEYQKPEKAEEEKLAEAPAEAEAPPPAPEPTPVPPPPTEPAEPEAPEPEAPAAEPEAAPAAEAEPEPEAEPAEAEEPAPPPTPEPTAAVEEEPPPAAGEIAPPSDLALVGVIQAGPSPAALIEYRGSQEMFRKGDTVFGQGTVESVRDDAVVIRGDAGSMTLKLPEAEADAPPPTPEPAVVQATPPPGPPTPPPVRKAISRNEAQAAMRDFRRVLSDAGAETADVGGGKGIRLGELPGDSFLLQLGLQSGDVLQKIGGVSLADPANLPDLSGAARGSQIEVTVVRNEIGLTFSRPLR